MPDYIQILLIGIMAFLYASVGHGGASGYLALMAIFGVSPALMKSSALILNVFVSLVAFVQYYRAGHFRWTLFWPFALTSVLASYYFADWPISDAIYKKLLAAALIVAVARMMFQPIEKDTVKPIMLPLALGIGLIIGALSGMLGIGGGIILTPVILLLGWGKVKETAAVSALFIFVNSLSGLAKLVQKGYEPNDQIMAWLVAALIGGFLGAYQGSFKLKIGALRYLLAVALFIACVKLYYFS